MARLKDIAQRAGVSISTVSRVLNQDRNFSVSFEVRQNVLRIAQELQYPIGASAKPLDGVPSRGDLGLVLLYSETDELEDPYYLSIRISLKAEALRLGARVVEYFHSDPSTVPKLGDHTVILVLGSGARWSKIVDTEVSAHCSTRIFVDFQIDDPHADFVMTDFEGLTRAALHHLLDCGFRRIGFIGSRDVNSSSHAVIQDARELFFSKILQDLGLFDQRIVYLASDTGMENGYALAKKALKEDSMPQAFFIETDTMAIGAVKAFKEAGLAVPGDISIVGCNDIPQAQYLHPALTTVRIHTDLMGIVAARMAVERAVMPNRAGIKTIVPNELIVRESCDGNR